jgi:AsmA-like C-terminal region
VLDGLLPEARETAATGVDLLKRIAPELLAIWPLPVEGKLKVRAGFIEYKHRRIEPLAATLDVEPKRARLHVKAAALCGIEFPFALEFTPQGVVASVRVMSKGKLLGATSGCLSDQQLLLTGEFDLRAELRTHGRQAELTTNLEGPVELYLGKGKLEKWAFLTSILGQESVKSLLAKKGWRMDDSEFEYRELVIRGRFAGGRCYIKEGIFDSPKLGLAATGSVGVDGHDAHLTVLVAPFSRIDSVVRKVPILGHVLGGALTSIPLGISGDIQNPQVMALSPTAVASQVVGIFERTFMLPAKLFTPLQHAGKPAEAER